jgi:DNA replication and repair protein RecF
MKLAEIDLMHEESGEFPVLLLDDVLSELDDRRKEFLLNSIGGLQTFITCTDRNFFNQGNDKAAFFYVEGGAVQRK